MERLLLTLLGKQRLYPVLSRSQASCSGLVPTPSLDSRGSWERRSPAAAGGLGQCWGALREPHRVPDRRDCSERGQEL